MHESSSKVVAFPGARKTSLHQAAHAPAGNLDQMEPYSDGQLARAMPDMPDFMLDEIDPLAISEDRGNYEIRVHQNPSPVQTSGTASRLRQIHPMDVVIIAGFAGIFFFL